MMEMPEGWKRAANHACVRAGRYKAHCHGNSDIGCGSLTEILTLMKEMAEALDAVEKRMQVWHDLSNLNRAEPVYQQEYLDIKNLNKKFKSWR